VTHVELAEYAGEIAEQLGVLEAAGVQHSGGRIQEHLRPVGAEAAHQLVSGLRVADDRAYQTRWMPRPPPSQMYSTTQGSGQMLGSSPSTSTRSAVRGSATQAIEAAHRRGLATFAGAVTVTRLAYRANRAENLRLQDASLNPPAERHSDGLRALAATWPSSLLTARGS